MTVENAFTEPVDVQEFRLSQATEVVVEWRDDESRKRVRIGVGGHPELVAAILTAPNNWGVIRLVDWNSRGRDEIVWCDGTDSARQHHEAAQAAKAVLR